MDTQRQNFWKESINNEVLIRNRWFQQHMSDGFSVDERSKPMKTRKITVSSLVYQYFGSNLVFRGIHVVL